MFDRTPKKPEAHELDVTITNLISELAGAETGSEEETRIAGAIKVLMEIRIADRADSRRPVLSPDAIASIAASLLGIGLILGFEKANVITTKAVSFIPKIKI